jgi:serine/threonine protein kinase
MSISNQHDDLNNDPHSTLPHWTSSTPATRFRILRPHAKGGLGEVYVAEDAELHRRVALKQIQQHHADHPEARSRFLLEAEITGGLEHPGIVPVYGLGAYEDGRPFHATHFPHFSKRSRWNPATWTNRNRPQAQSDPMSRLRTRVHRGLNLHRGDKLRICRRFEQRCSEE